MSSPRRLALTFVVSFLAMFSLASALGARIVPAGAEDVQEQPLGVEVEVEQHEAGSFAQLLDTASPDVLHRLLHAYFPDRYKHGVYPSDNDAIEAVHADDAPLATALVQLARRQLSNSTATTSADTPSATETSLPPAETTDSPAATTTPAETGATTAAGATSTAAAPGTTTAQGGGVTSSPVPKTFTSTLPNGEVSLYTQTSWVVVGADDTATSSSRPDASLQNAAPTRVPGQVAIPALFGAAVAGYFAA